MKPMLKAPGCTRLKLSFSTLLLSIAFNCNLRRYNKECLEEIERVGVQGLAEAGADTGSRFSST
jgi:hypothetical protein